ncbi:MAG: CDP-alcohol phosphatidyltransferase family protein [Clostridiaceae bacterium]|jgi:cardiolipin synthase|nr:CDP-alcohol phosphatidyltransferase family protein [Clostridiaceae bacterium]
MSKNGSSIRDHDQKRGLYSDMREGMYNRDEILTTKNALSLSHQSKNDRQNKDHTSEAGIRDEYKGQEPRPHVPFFKLNVPNVITFIRFVAIVPLAAMISKWPAYRMTSFVLFLAIWMTDLLDGWIARTFNMITGFGKLFDPFVDKVFQVVTVIMLSSIDRIPIWVPLYYVFRELLMIFGSTLLLARSRVVVYSDIFGKLSTFLFVVAASLVLLIPEPLGIFRNLIFLPAIITSLIAMAHYAIKHTSKKNKE